MTNGEKGILKLLSSLSIIENKEDLLEQFCLGLKKLFPDKEFKWSLSMQSDLENQEKIFTDQQLTIYLHYDSIPHEINNHLKDALTLLNHQLKHIPFYNNINFSGRIEHTYNLYKCLFENNKDATYIIDPEGKILGVNKAACNMLGYSNSELLKLTIGEIDANFNSEHFKKYWKNKKTEDDSLFITDHIDKNGNKIPVEVNGFIVHTKNTAFIYGMARDISEKKHAEKLLQDSEEKFRLLFENMNSALAYHQIFVDENNKPVNFNYLEVNPAFEKMTGLKSKNIIGKMVLEVLPDLEDYWIQKFGSVALTGNPIEYTNYVKELDRYYETRTYSPKKGYFAVNFFEVTERVKAEQALRKSEEKYKFLAENTSDIVSMHDMLGSFIYISPSIERLTGYTAEEYKKLSPVENVHPDDQEIILNLINDYTSNIRSTTTLEYRIRKKNGSYIWIESRSKAMKDKNGVLQYMLTSSNDITERKKAEIALLESEEAFRNIFKYVAIGIAYISNEGNFLKVNKKYKEITGYQTHEFDHLKIKQITHPDDFKIETEHLEKIENGAANNYQIEKRIKHKKGFYIWVDKNMSVIKDEQNNIKYLVSAIIDITNQKNFEKQLQKINQKIGLQNQRFLKKNKELENSNKKVREVNNKLKKANQELDSFVYRVSHDLRAPITSSMGLSDLIVNSKDLQEIQKFSLLQKESLLKLDQFIRDILNYSRNSRMEVVPESIDFEEIVSNAFDENRYALERSHLSIIKDLPSDYSFHSDKLRLNIILKNLISNSIKFINPFVDKPFVKISIEVNKQATILVEDNGIGIESVHQDRIFEMFYRATDKKPGSGIGLYILKDCLDKVNGTIAIESELGEGTRFTLQIPNLK